VWDGAIAEAPLQREIVTSGGARVAYPAA
jgi:hypothetical protein